ncbi:MAG: helix-turn-helix domain-containing protein [Acidimicrobiales bacterium]
MRIEAAAAMLGVTVRWMRRAVEERVIPYHRVGRFLLFQPADLREFFSRTRVSPGMICLCQRGSPRARGRPASSRRVRVAPGPGPEEGRSAGSLQSMTDRPEANRPAAESHSAESGSRWG